MTEPARTPPQNLEAEAAVLGALLQDSEALLKAIDALRPEHFYREGHRRIFAAARALHDRDVGVDLVSLTEELRRRGELEAVGGATALAALLYTFLEQVPTAANVVHHARIVRDKATARALLDLCLRTVEKAWTDGADLAALLSGHRSELEAILRTETPRRLRALSLCELMATTFPPRPAHVRDGILPAQGKAVIAGTGGVGKTVALLQTAVERATGRAWFGRWLGDERSRVGLLLQEDPLEITQERLRKLARGLGVDEGADLPVFVNDPVRYLDITKDADLAQVIAFVRDRGIDLLVPDPLITFHREDENSNARMRYVLDRFTAVQSETGCAVLVAHHHRRPPDGGEDPEPARGARAIQDWARTVINLTWQGKVDGRDRIRLTFTKLNYGPMPPGPVTLERDPGSLLLRVVDEEEMCSPERAAQVLEGLGGEVPRKADWYVAIRTETGCSDRTAREAAGKAIERGLVLEGERTREGQHVKLAPGISFGGCGNPALPLT